MAYTRKQSGFQGFFIEPEVREALKARAVQDERSVSALIRIYIRRGLEADGVRIAESVKEAAK